MSRKTAFFDHNAFNPAYSVFVSANAGSGKTSLLTKRVLSLLLHGVAPSKILCITYTNAASAEMQSRIYSELGRWVMLDDTSLNASLRELLGRPPDTRMLQRARSLFAMVLEVSDDLRIQTIHGLCQSLLRRFSLESGVKPHFSVMDNRSAQELLQEARLRLYAHAQSHDPALQQALYRLASDISENTMNEVFDAIVDHKQKFQWLFAKQGGREQAIEQLWAAVDIKKDTKLVDLIDRYFDYDAKTIANLRSICEQLMQGKKTDIATGAALAQWLERPECRESCVDAYLNAFITDEGTPRKTIYTKDTFSDVKCIDALMQEQARALAFSQALRSWRIVLRTIDIMHLAEAFLALYEQQKRAYAAVDYDDMILAGLRLLDTSAAAAWVLFKLDDGIDHVLVDESQDTSPEQWKIVQALTGEFFSGLGKSDIDRSLFIVGDEKQSIYSFQGADMRAMTRMQQYFLQRIRDAGKPLTHMALTHSYRSTSEILLLVDAVFANATVRKGVVSGEEKLEHIPTRADASGLVELWPLIVSEKDNAVSPDTLLARHIADSIAKWIATGQRLDSKNRAVEAGDILVLVRKRTGFVDSLVRNLKRRNIPVGGIDRMVLSDNLAIQDLIALTQVVLLPEDDLSLACVLKSPIFNISEETLFALAFGREKQSLWRRLSENVECVAAYNLLLDLRARSDFMPPYEFYAYLLDHCGARARFIGRMGAEYADPIDEFLSQSLVFQQNHPPSMQGFLHWFTRSESEIKRDMEQAGNHVRIMTVHGAKGLQAPIVILPDTLQAPRLNALFFWSPDDILLWPGAAKNDNILSAALRAEQKNLMMEEYRRLLYVALTRAEDRLYICGAAGKEKISEDSWYALVRSAMQPLAATFETPRGNALRLGIEPVCGALPLVEQSLQPQMTADFSFLASPLPQEQVPTRPLTPSIMETGDVVSLSPMSGKTAYERGRFIHALLQYLPQVSSDQREKTAYLLSASFGLDDVVKKQSIAQTLRIIDDPRHAFLFSDDALTEVPVIGNVKVKNETFTVSGQIDRLYIGRNELWIVDFKTGLQPAHIPASYLRQMALYRLLIQKIYPAKPIICALLWTGTANITVLDESHMSTYI